ncbi:winged helix-turn-helix transcriptional regulator [Streptomyces lushanensis]|uniref:winged helix-turn-helix transcriptional regulator n=1 Tax=Streptomyces lushanensis TaxID=1434255 RepID=UPI00099F591D|nr:helix-turn-helix domain-containing protein [Streptomyces lushanensis]
MTKSQSRAVYTCGLDAAVDVVGGKWKPLILWALHDGPHRFGALRRHVSGVSEKMLIQQLRELEADGVVHREVYREVPPRVEYSLTDMGQALNTALLPLGVWGDAFMGRIVANKLSERPDGPGPRTETESRPLTEPLPESLTALPSVNAPAVAHRS